MSAFNRRFDIKRVVGMQMPMAMGLVGLLITAVFSMILLWPIKILALFLFFFSLAAVIYVAYYGDDIAFARVIVETKRNKKLTTVEHQSRI